MPHVDRQIPCEMSRQDEFRSEEPFDPRFEHDRPRKAVVAHAADQAAKHRPFTQSPRFFHYFRRDKRHERRSRPVVFQKFGQEPGAVAGRAAVVASDESASTVKPSQFACARRTASARGVSSGR